MDPPQHGQKRKILDMDNVGDISAKNQESENGSGGVVSEEAEQMDDSLEF